MHEIQCAEIWGGTAAAESDLCTPGVCAAIHSTASGARHGGDIYYFSVCQYESLTRIAVADVRGHGEAVSHLSRWVYAALQRRMNDSNGARVLTELNAVARERGFEAITTAVVATFHRERRTLSYAYAGHPPMLLGRAGEDWEPLLVEDGTGPANLPLGALPSPRYTQATARVEPGDRLFLCTDGVRECPGADAGEDYGDERLLALLRTTAGEPLARIGRRVRDDLLSHAGGKLDHDDCTFLMVEVLEPPAPFWKRGLQALASALPGPS
jgi:serine phosphatase RsbU (regulator of sigma subunit)